MRFTTRIRHDRPCPRRGAAAVECALVLPLLIPIFFGCVDFGRFAHAYIAVTNAARVGAGYASSHPFGPADQPIWEYRTKAATLEEMGSLKDDAIVTPPEFFTSAEDGGHDHVKVTVEYRFVPLFGWAWLLPGTSEIALKRVVEMRYIAS